MNYIKGGSKGYSDISPFISGETYEILQNIYNQIIRENIDLDKKILKTFNLQKNKIIKYFIEKEEAGEDPDPDEYEILYKKLKWDLMRQINKLKNNEYNFGEPEFKAIYDISELSKLDTDNNLPIIPKSDRWFNRAVPSFLLKTRFYCDTKRSDIEGDYNYKFDFNYFDFDDNDNFDYDEDFDISSIEELIMIKEGEEDELEVFTITKDPTKKIYFTISDGIKLHEKSDGFHKVSAINFFNATPISSTNNFIYNMQSTSISGRKTYWFVINIRYVNDLETTALIKEDNYFYFKKIITKKMWEMFEDKFLYLIKFNNKLIKLSLFNNIKDFIINENKKINYDFIIDRTLHKFENNIDDIHQNINDILDVMDEQILLIYNKKNIIDNIKYKSKIGPNIKSEDIIGRLSYFDSLMDNYYEIQNINQSTIRQYLDTSKSLILQLLESLRDLIIGFFKDILINFNYIHDDLIQYHEFDKNTSGIDLPDKDTYLWQEKPYQEKIMIDLEDRFEIIKSLNFIIGNVKQYNPSASNDVELSSKRFLEICKYLFDFIIVYMNYINTLYLININNKTKLLKNEYFYHINDHIFKNYNYSIINKEKYHYFLDFNMYSDINDRNNFRQYCKTGIFPPDIKSKPIIVKNNSYKVDWSTSFHHVDDTKVVKGGGWFNKNKINLPIINIPKYEINLNKNILVGGSNWEYSDDFEIRHFEHVYKKTVFLKTIGEKFKDTFERMDISKELNYNNLNVDFNNSILSYPINKKNGEKQIFCRMNLESKDNNCHILKNSIINNFFIIGFFDNEDENGHKWDYGLNIISKIDDFKTQITNNDINSNTSYDDKTNFTTTESNCNFQLNFNLNTYYIFEDILNISNYYYNSTNNICIEYSYEELLDDINAKLIDKELSIKQSDIHDILYHDMSNMEISKKIYNIIQDGINKLIVIIKKYKKKQLQYNNVKNIQKILKGLDVFQYIKDTVTGTVSNFIYKNLISGEIREELKNIFFKKRFKTWEQYVSTKYNVNIQTLINFNKKINFNDNKKDYGYINAYSIILNLIRTHSLDIFPTSKRNFNYSTSFANIETKFNIKWVINKKIIDNNLLSIDRSDPGKIKQFILYQEFILKDIEKYMICHKYVKDDLINTTPIETVNNKIIKITSPDFLYTFKITPTIPIYSRSDPLNIYADNIDFNVKKYLGSFKFKRTILNIEAFKEGRMDNKDMLFSDIDTKNIFNKNFLNMITNFERRKIILEELEDFLKNEFKLKLETYKVLKPIILFLMGLKKENLYKKHDNDENKVIGFNNMDDLDLVDVDDFGNKEELQIYNSSFDKKEKITIELNEDEYDDNFIKTNSVTYDNKDLFIKIGSIYTTIYSLAQDINNNQSEHRKIYYSLLFIFDIIPIGICKLRGVIDKDLHYNGYNNFLVSQYVKLNSFNFYKMNYQLIKKKKTMMTNISHLKLFSKISNIHTLNNNGIKYEISNKDGFIPHNKTTTNYLFKDRNIKDHYTNLYAPNGYQSYIRREHKNTDYTHTKCFFELIKIKTDSIIKNKIEEDLNFDDIILYHLDKFSQKNLMTGFDYIKDNLRLIKFIENSDYFQIDKNIVIDLSMKIEEYKNINQLNNDKIKRIQLKDKVLEIINTNTLNFSNVENIDQCILVKDIEDNLNKLKNIIKNIKNDYNSLKKLTKAVLSRDKNNKMTVNIGDTIISLQGILEYIILFFENIIKESRFFINRLTLFQNIILLDPRTSYFNNDKFYENDNNENNVFQDHYNNYFKFNKEWSNIYKKNEFQNLDEWKIYLNGKLTEFDLQYLQDSETTYIESLITPGPELDDDKLNYLDEYFNNEGILYTLLIFSYIKVTITSPKDDLDDNWYKYYGFTNKDEFFVFYIDNWKKLVEITIDSLKGEEIDISAQRKAINSIDNKYLIADLRNKANQLDKNGNWLIIYHQIKKIISSYQAAKEPSRFRIYCYINEFVIYFVNPIILKHPLNKEFKGENIIEITDNNKISEKKFNSIIELIKKVIDNYLPNESIDIKLKHLINILTQSIYDFQMKNNILNVISDTTQYKYDNYALKWSNSGKAQDPIFNVDLNDYRINTIKYGIGDDEDITIYNHKNINKLNENIYFISKDKYYDTFSGDAIKYIFGFKKVFSTKDNNTLIIDKGHCLDAIMNYKETGIERNKKLVHIRKETENEQILTNFRSLTTNIESKELIDNLAKNIDPKFKERWSVTQNREVTRWEAEDNDRLINIKFNYITVGEEPNAYLEQLKLTEKIIDGQGTEMLTSGTSGVGKSKILFGINSGNILVPGLIQTVLDRVVDSDIYIWIYEIYVLGLQLKGFWDNNKFYLIRHFDIEDPDTNGDKLKLNKGTWVRNTQYDKKKYLKYGTIKDNEWFNYKNIRENRKWIKINKNSIANLPNLMKEIEQWRKTIHSDNEGPYKEYVTISDTINNKESSRSNLRITFAIKIDNTFVPLGITDNPGKEDIYKTYKSYYKNNDVKVTVGIERINNIDIGKDNYLKKINYSFINPFCLVTYRNFFELFDNYITNKPFDPYKMILKEYANIAFKYFKLNKIRPTQDTLIIKTLEIALMNPIVFLNDHKKTQRYDLRPQIFNIFAKLITKKYFKSNKQDIKYGLQGFEAIGICENLINLIAITGRQMSIGPDNNINDKKFKDILKNSSLFQVDEKHLVSIDKDYYMWNKVSKIYDPNKFLSLKNYNPDAMLGWDIFKYSYDERSLTELKNPETVLKINENLLLLLITNHIQPWKCAQQMFLLNSIKPFLEDMYKHTNES